MIGNTLFDVAAKELDERITDIQLLRRALPPRLAEERKTAENEILEKSVIVHKLQADYYYRGINVFIAWDRSGLPIRVCKGCRSPIVGY